MRSSIKKWGNSLAVRLPMPLLKSTDLQEGTAVEISMSGQNIIIQPVNEPDEYDLALLVEKITDENLHAEIDTGKPVGNEIW
jgi:antitoxin MazE